MKNLKNTHVVYNEQTKEYELIDLTTGESMSGSGHKSLAERFIYNLPLAKHICQRIAEGQTIKKISDEEGMPSASVIATWRSVHPDFDEAIKTARKVRAEHLHDKVLETAEDLIIRKFTKDEVAARKVAIDAFKWGAEKNDRESFGSHKSDSGGNGPATIVINTGIVRQKEPTEVENGRTIRGRATRRGEGEETSSDSGRGTEKEGRLRESEGDRPPRREPAQVGLGKEGQSND